MKKHLIILLFLVGANNLFGANDEQQVVDCFIAYKESLKKQDGKKALDLINQKSLQYYDSMVKLSVNGSEKEVKKLRMIDRMMVLIIRHKIDGKTLLKMSGKDLFRLYVDKGWLNQDGLGRVDIGKVTFYGTKASGHVVHKGRPTPLTISFTNDKGKWQIDLTSLLDNTNSAFVMMAKRAKMEENQYVIKVIEASTGQKVSPNIWKPIAKK